MKDYQRAFIQLALKCGALKFGEFTLKSGRKSPYFFNAGLFNTGQALAELGRHYAAALLESQVDFDMVFGPAYKGIPLAAATVAALADTHGRDLPYSFNRKEAKDHGEGGSLVGAPLRGNVAIVDDVITAGTAMREVLALLDGAGARAAVILIGLNRQERGLGKASAIEELMTTTGVPVVSIIALEDILVYLQSEQTDPATVERILQYRNEYGV